MLVVGFAASGLLLGERIEKQRLSILAVLLLTSEAAGGLGMLLWHHIWIGMTMPLGGY